MEPLARMHGDVVHLLAAGQEHYAFAFEMRLDEAPKHIQLLRQLHSPVISRQNAAQHAARLACLYDHVVLAESSRRRCGGSIVHAAVPKVNTAV
jgi:hypothetical protein